MSESPRKSASWIIEECIYGSHEWIASVQEPGLIGLPTVHGGRYIHFADRHDGDFFVPGCICSIALVIKPITTDDADGVRRSLDIFYNFRTSLGGKDIGAVDGFSAKNGVHAVVNGTR